MRDLLWKDFRQNRKVLLTVGIVALVPYVVPCIVLLVAITVGVIRHHERIIDLMPGLDHWADNARGASFVSMGLSAMLAAFIGGNAIAGERADRSAEFAAGLPIPRGKAVISKATVAAASCLAMWAINAAVWTIAFLVAYRPYVAPPGFFVSHESAIALICLLCTVLLFGLSWLYSALLSSPAISAAAAIGTAMGLFRVVQSLCGYQWEKGMNDSFWTCLLVLPPLIGVLCLAAGATICLKRVEP